MAQIEAQSVEIEKHQAAEASSCLERNGLEEQLRQAQERIHVLEQASFSQSAEKACSNVSPTSIVPFSTISNRLSPMRSETQFEEPADFTMLFMSDEFPLFTTPADQAKMNTPKNVDRSDDHHEQENIPPTTEIDATKVFDIPQDMDSPSQRANTKRKAVNFLRCRKQSSEKPNESDTTGAGFTGSQEDPKRPEVHGAQQPAQAKKHVNKWTYSRVQALENEMQQEQPPTVGRAASSAQRRPGLKGFVSVSSSTETGNRTNTRGRGKRGSKG